MCNLKINIPKDANHIIHTLQNNGHSAYVVGGCVRDSILGRNPHDWDICTSATPDEILSIFKDNKIVETGLKHGTVTIIINGEPYEVTTYRIDGKYSDNRRPDTVTYTDNLVEDLKRRDFTINAMAYNDDEGLIDPFNGIEDIENKIIRCVGSAEDRFEEDALRILRAIRFASQLDFDVHSNTAIAIEKLAKDKLNNVSIERINSEFCKIVESKSFYKQIILYKDIIELFIPEFYELFGFNQKNPYHDYDVYGHTVHAIRHCESDDLIVRLAVFFHDFGKPRSCQECENGTRHFYGHGKVSAELTDIIMKRLKFDNETKNKVTELVLYHDATLDKSKKHIKRWLNKIGAEQFKRLLDVRKADIRGQKIVCDESRIEEVNEIETSMLEVLQEKECFSLKSLAVNGKDLMDIGFKPGKVLGEALNSLLQLVINEECLNDKETLLDKAKSFL